MPQIIIGTTAMMAPTRPEPMCCSAAAVSPHPAAQHQRFGHVAREDSWTLESAVPTKFCILTETSTSIVLNAARAARAHQARHRESDWTMIDFNTCDLCDAHEGDTSGSFRVLPAVFRDFGSTLKFSGQVVTLRCVEDNSVVREVVKTPGEGRVLVVDGAGSVRRALVGGVIALNAAKSGWAGILVYGAVRDAQELRDAGIPVKALALMPLRSVKRDEGQRDLPVEIAGVWVRPGDWLYADEDGVVASARSLT